MLIHNDEQRVQVKIVVFGPAMSGKTTALKALFRQVNGGIEDTNGNDQPHGRNITSVETSTGRTLFFDFGSIRFTGESWTVDVHVYSTTGQDFYQATRPSILQGVDAILFVVDSQRPLLQYNQQSWAELKRYLEPVAGRIPVAFLLNKQDLDESISVEEFMAAFSIPSGWLRNTSIVPGIAIKGDGVMDAFKDIMGVLLPSFKI